MKYLALLSLLLCCARCGSADVVEPNAVRREIQASLAAVDQTKPLELRYNPVSCNCPPFELRLGQHWLRAELAGTESEKYATWLAWLSQTPLEALPTAVKAKGTIERELLRTAQGNYAVRIEISEIESPKQTILQHNTP